MSARPFRLTSWEPSEADILAAVLELCQRHPWIAWAGRVNRGVKVVPYIDKWGRQRKRWIDFNTIEGCSDVIGQFKRSGRWLAIECKKHGQEPKLEQQSFLDLVAQNGGAAGCAHSVDEARAIIEGKGGNA